MTFVFFTGAQKAFSLGWREAARPLLMDYVDRLAAEVTPDASKPPDVTRALALTQRLPITVDIAGPSVNWRSHPAQERPGWHRDDESPHASRNNLRDGWGDGKKWEAVLQRSTADGHTIEFSIDEQVFERRPRLVGYALAALLLLTLLAWLYVRHLLRPLDAIGEGARRFGAGDFSQPIPQRSLHGPDELGELAATINTMGNDIRQMLDAKRALLLAISHELRSPLTRARLHTELLPEGPDIQPQRDALLRDLQEMSQLISDLLESERLAGGHAALQREPTDVAALVREVVAGLHTPGAGATPAVVLDLPPDAHLAWVDPSRLRLLLRNLLNNSLRHAAGAAKPPEVAVTCSWPGSAAPGLTVVVRDHGPGVPGDQLAQLAQAFHRPDSARTRSAGGVGLGLYLCRLVAQAHGGTLSLSNAQPGLRVTVSLPQANPPLGPQAR